MQTIGANPTKNQRINLAKRREKLLTMITQFQENAEKFLDLHDQDVRPPETIDNDWSDTETVAPSATAAQRRAARVLVVVDNNTRRLSLGQVENIALLLPSRLGKVTCRAQHIKGIAQKEIKLRVGQANDALHQLRQAIGHKSFLFRKRLRNAKSKVRKTKAWDDINAVGTTVTHHRRVYNNARNALRSIGAPSEILDEYRPITSADTKSSTIIVDPNARGQRNKSLPWFWGSNTPSAPDNGEIMAECECTFLHSYRKLNWLQFTEFIGSGRTPEVEDGKKNGN